MLALNLLLSLDIFWEESLPLSLGFLSSSPRLEKEDGQLGNILFF